MLGVAKPRMLGLVTRSMLDLVAERFGLSPRKVLGPPCFHDETKVDLFYSLLSLLDPTLSFFLAYDRHDHIIPLWLRFCFLWAEEEEVF